LLNYDSPSALAGFLDSRGLGMRKRYGQNFLVDPAARERLLDALELRPGDGVWEIGPGLGAMTAGLLERGAEVRAFEVDPGFVEALELIFKGAPGFSLIPGDVLKTWRSAEGAPLLLGNLPYTIAAVLLAVFIEEERFFKRMVVTVQREVARRMLAKPGDGDYSSLSVLCASAYTMTPLMVLKGAAFYPVPRVDSQAVRFDLRGDVDPAGYSPLFKPLVRALFAFRRKTVYNNLQSFAAARGLAPSREAARGLSMRVLEQCGLAPEVRAEKVGIETFSALAEALENSGEGGINPPVSPGKTGLPSGGPLGGGHGRGRRR
jgi:16S rRNA (adenine1518-N6/adenine1519-N6)-dimethyltransferase